MIYTISTSPGHSALAFQASDFIPPLATPPFDDLQSNAPCFAPCSFSGKPGSHRETQIGLGILFSRSSDSLSHVDSSGIPIDRDHPSLERPPLFLDSPRPSPALNAVSPAGDLRLRCTPVLENDHLVLDADFNTSSSDFSIRDWIINPSSSPAPSDAPCRPSPAPPQFLSAPDALHRPPDTSACLNSFSVALTVPETSTAIDPAVLAAPRTQSPSTNAVGPHSTMDTTLLQVVERIHFGRILVTTCLSPSQTLIPRRGYVSSHVSSDQPSVQPPPDVMSAESDCGRSPGSVFATPVGVLRDLASNNVSAVGTALTSPLNLPPSNGYAKYHVVSPDTPALNMHEGVSEYDLQRRVNRYRRRYPGRSLDRHWLSKYAGKLNKDGKAIEDYRFNKRRDHIMVHICSHVNERPFACRHCHMTFLRRNECKRHEAGHSGLKPFVCRHCPPPASRFARQDLLTRHVRRAHDTTAQEQRGKRQRSPEMTVWSEPVSKRAHVPALCKRNSQETCLVQSTR
ncbi:hypothetical protein F5148DRAFT_1165183 [Russula earlei]|uniref:Uncharacterized protein n=1 Tax=Russula earlei TaxID=71964 RepID=A0ACC0ULU2_9AGAM|nr:hypothetical protein F5148DRAFT_1165183 [Russula earlei]